MQRCSGPNPSPPSNATTSNPSTKAGSSTWSTRMRSAAASSSTAPLHRGLPRAQVGLGAMGACPFAGRRGSVYAHAPPCVASALQHRAMQPLLVTRAAPSDKVGVQAGWGSCADCPCLHARMFASQRLAADQLSVMHNGLGSDANAAACHGTHHAAAQDVLDARNALLAAQTQIDALTRQVATAGQLQQHMAQQDELLAKLQDDLAASELSGQVRHQHPTLHRSGCLCTHDACLLRLLCAGQQATSCIACSRVGPCAGGH